ncbi:putative Ig domain-containing protein [Rhizobium sp. BK176]|uniref:putative Ig domain-containing protein n=1 Tax=Rhizobium sp. BK176 TaxID=2587071 RepID=UPI0021678829|nr:putative Ig domain-containing protein [Rhizobium sp. BK176]MCS4088648.1 hypothetical protein [Rhizobium sp. BK176]
MLKKLTSTALIALQVLTPAFAANASDTFMYRYVKTTGVLGSSGAENPQPGKVPDRTLATVIGSAGYDRLSSESPDSVIDSLKEYLDGDVVFDGASPAIPGMLFDTSTGLLEGIPSSSFKGSVVISYHDASNKPGKLYLPLVIYPQPTLVSSDTYELPRTFDAAQFSIGVEPGNDGFYNGVDYSLAPTSDALPHGLSLSGNKLVGATDAALNSVYSIVIRGTSKTNAAIFADRAFTLKVVGQSQIALDLQDKPLVWQFDDATKKVVSAQVFDPAPKPTGTFASPLTWTKKSGPDWLGVDSNGQLTGTPAARGTYDYALEVKDGIGNSASDTATLKVVTPGYVYLAPGAQFLHVRSKETFATAAQTASNNVGAITYHPSGVPEGVSFNETTGVFTGTFDDAASHIWHLNVSDEEGRTDANGGESGTNYVQSVETHGPVALGAATSATGGTMDSPEAPLFVQWPSPENIIGTPSYTINGAIPGTLYYKTYDQNKASGLVTYTSAGGNATKQGAGETVAQVEAKLAADHIVFDTLAMTLSGVPSASGSYPISLYVADDHEETGYKLNPYEITRATSNSATSPQTTLNVQGRSILAVNVLGNSEALSQYTSVPKNGIALRDSASNTAYKGGATWTLVSGTLPPGISTVISAEQDSLSFTGYPSTQGTYDNLVWKVVANGRTFNTTPLSMVVGPRVALALEMPQSVGITVRAGTQPVNQVVNVLNTPNGEIIPPASWTVTGLPEGVSYAISKNVLTLSGTALKTGSYTPSFTVVDSKGGNATATMPIAVVAPFISYTNGGNNPTISQYTQAAASSTIIRDAGSNDTWSGALTWTLVSGTLPPGITTSYAYNGAQINYNGYATATGTYSNIVWKVTDTQGNSIQTAPLTFTVKARDALALTANPGLTVSGTVDNPINITITPSNTPAGEKITAWTITGAAPDGMTVVSKNGVLTYSGAPTTFGTYGITIKADDSMGGSATVVLTIKVGTQLLAYNNGCCSETLRQYTTVPTSNTVIRVAASNTTYTGGATFALATGTLPPGLSIVTKADGSGYSFTGYPTAQGTYSNITYNVTDPYGNVFQTKPIEFVVLPRADLQLSATPGNTRQMILNTDDALTTVTASNIPNGGTIPTANWSMTGTLPPGVARTAKTDGYYFTGKATAVGTYNVVVTAVDSMGGTASYPITFNVTSAGMFTLTNSAATQTIVQYGTKPTITTTSKLTSTNALYPATWKLVSGKLPPGITATPSADGTSLVYSGYASQTGTFGGIIWVATDGNGNQAVSTAVSFTVTARTALKVTANPTTGIQTWVTGKGSASTTVTASNIPSGGNAVDNIDWTVTGVVPPGITWSVVNGVVKFAGTSIAPKDYYNIKVTAIDETGQTATVSLEFNITTPFNTIGQLTSQSNAQNVVCNGDCYYYSRTETLQLNTTTPTVQWRIVDLGNASYAVTSFALDSGSLPPGVQATLNAAKTYLQFTGVPTATGTYTAQFTLTDKNGVKRVIPGITFVVE